MSTSTASVGLCLAVASAVFNGSFAALFKTKKMTALNIHPMVFQLYVCFGMFLSSLLVIPLLYKNPALFQDDTVGDQLCFSGYGVLAGCLFVLAITGSFNAISDIGIALAQGIWSGGAMLVSYLWGVFIFGQTPKKLPLSLFSLFVLVVGVLVIALSSKIARMSFIQRNKRGYESIEDSNDTSDPETTTVKIDIPDHSSDKYQYVRGILWAVFVGIFGGSILVPLNYVPSEAQGLVFLPSFGLGTMILSPLVYYANKFQTGSLPPLHLKQALITGVTSGFISNVAMMLNILAIPSIGYGVAYPIMQCAILVSGMWGIYAFHEITDLTTIVIFWLGGGTLVIGGFLLALSQ
mmetsp:Transcript_23515/g.32984  ORF Transcript_23515/g.32984 Transcript_23515/m.32984 type:complete len:350 (-) Transcript_23515:144-1193(-)